MNHTLIDPLTIPFSALGLGCVTFGREIDQGASFVMMDHALAHGITLFDTASAYGGGASETIVGAWLTARRPARDTLIIATKLLPPYEPVQIMAAVDQSLQRLGTDTIDLLYLHRWDPSIETTAALETFQALIQSGKIRMLGASNFNAAQISETLRRQAALGYARLGSFQNNHNLAVSDIDEAIFNIAAEHNIALVTYSPLGAGFLTGKYQQGMPGSTRFSVIPGHQDIYFQEAACRRLDTLQKVAASTGHSPVHLALAWAMHQPGVTSVLVGGRNTAQLDQAFAAQAFNDSAIFAALESA
ncbi:aldo/keto reductase [Chitinophaga sp. MM2321]|uniref:aldo/keto reductase n=1 Tax=Chitinophaga sp. MM2321 TaxID=3137178 RepID=UPI0032D5773C